MSLTIVSTSGPTSITVTLPWTVPAMTLQTGSSIDLKTTLGTNVPTNGTFTLASGSTPLPLGVTLSAAGLLAATGTAVAGASSGIIFSYTYIIP